jgi:RNA polymerase sigma factor (sigma-70 family)
MNSAFTPPPEATAGWPDGMRSALLAEAARLSAYTNAAGHDEEDLIAEGLLCAGRALATFDPSRGVPLLAYFGKVVLRRRFLSLGARGRFRTGPAALGKLAEAEAGGWRAEEARREVRDAIDRLLLDDPQGKVKREAFVLYHLEGHNLRELSERFGRSVTTLHRWIKQGEACLKVLWGRDDP